MRWIKRLFGMDKPRSGITTRIECCPEDDINPPFKYLQQRHSCDIAAYSRVADLLREAAIETVPRFARITSATVPSIQPNDQLVHYFFDLYLALHSKRLGFDENTDLACACIDGIHFTYYGQVQEPVSSVLELLAERKNRCFLATFFSILKRTDFPIKLGTYAQYCCGDVGGATDALYLGTIVLDIAKCLQEPLGKDIQRILHG